MDNIKIRTLLLPSEINYSTSINLIMMLNCISDILDRTSLILAPDRVVSNEGIRVKWDDGDVEYSAWKIK